MTARSTHWWTAIVATCVVALAGCGGSDAEPRTSNPSQDVPVAKTTAPTEEDARMVTTGDFADFIASRSEPPIAKCARMQSTTVPPQYADIGAVRFAQAECEPFVIQAVTVAKMQSQDAAQAAVANPEPWLFAVSTPPPDLRKSERDGATCWVVPAQPGGIEIDQSVCFQAVADLLMVVAGGRDGGLQDVQSAMSQAVAWAG